MPNGDEYFAKEQLVNFLVNEYEAGNELARFAVENFYCDSEAVKKYPLLEDAAEFVYSTGKYWTD